MKTLETALVTRSAAFISWTPLSRPSRHGLGYERAVVTQMKAADRATKALSTPLSAEWRPRVVFAREEGGRRSQPHRPPQMRSATKRMHKPTSETAPFRGHRPVHDNPPAAGAVPARHGRDGREPPLVRGGGSGPPLQSNPAQSPLPPVAPSQSRLRAKRRASNTAAARTSRCKGPSPPAHHHTRPPAHQPHKEPRPNDAVAALRVRE